MYQYSRKIRLTPLIFLKMIDDGPSRGPLSQINAGHQSR
jgi:hypothetical protein